MYGFTKIKAVLFRLISNYFVLQNDSYYQTENESEIKDIGNVYMIKKNIIDMRMGVAKVINDVSRVQKFRYKPNNYKSCNC